MYIEYTVTGQAGSFLLSSSNCFFLCLEDSCFTAPCVPSVCKFSPCSQLTNLYSFKTDDGLTGDSKSRAVTLSQCHTVRLSHCHNVTLSGFHTVTLSHCHTVTPSHCHNVTMSHCQAFTLPHCYTATLSHCLTVTLSHCHTVILSLWQNVSLSNCYTLTHCHTVILTYCHTVTLDYCHKFTHLPTPTSPPSIHICILANPAEMNTLGVLQQYNADFTNCYNTACITGSIVTISKIGIVL